MAAQTRKIIQLIMIQNFLDFFRQYERLLENPKTWDTGELFLTENDFKTYSTVKWLKNRN